MPIVIKTPSDQIKVDFTSQYNERVKKVILYNLAYVGEACVAEARLNGRYQDQTGNLRSSIAYVIVDDGKIANEGRSQKFLEGTQGETDGIRYARELAAEHPKGIVLIVVAGMEYAVYVEARGLNVLSSAELLANSLVPQIMRSIGFKVT